MKNAEVANELRALADELDALPVEIELQINATSYSVVELEALSAIASLMDQPLADKNRGYHWLKGMFRNIEVTAHYTAGLLGKVRKKKVTVQEAERVEKEQLKRAPKRRW